MAQQQPKPGGSTVFEHTENPKKRSSWWYILSALILFAGVYLSELIYFVEDLLFSWIYYGNLNAMFVAVVSAAYIFVFISVFHKQLKRRFGESPFANCKQKMRTGQKAILYFMTVMPILIVAVSLGTQFKLVYELGERVAAMTMLGNLARYVNAAAKLFCAVYLIWLVESACDHLPSRIQWIPFGGLGAMLSFGLMEILVTPSEFSLLYFFLHLYIGVIYRMSDRRFGVTYGIAVVLYIL